MNQRRTIHNAIGSAYVAEEAIDKIAYAIQQVQERCCRTQESMDKAKQASKMAKFINDSIIDMVKDLESLKRLV